MCRIKRWQRSINGKDKKKRVDAPPRWTVGHVTILIGLLTKVKSNNYFLEGLVRNLFMLRFHSGLLCLFLLKIIPSGFTEDARLENTSSCRGKRISYSVSD